MLLPPFELHRPTRLAEALDLLAAHEDEDAVVYMGGTELLLLMKLGLSSPGHLVDSKALEELQGIAVDDDTITIGAATTHREIELDPSLRRHLPALPELARQVANIRVRNVGTLGGNLCFAEPHSDPATLLIALGAVAELTSPRGTRELALEEFLLGAFSTTLSPDELLVRLRIPRPANSHRVRYRRLAFRERPVVGVAAVADPHLRLVVGAVGSRPTTIGDDQLGLPTSDRAIRELGGLAATTVEPIPDADGSVDYKRHLTQVMVEQTVRDLIESPA